MKKVAFFGKSDLGKIRTNNEDAFLVCNIWDNEHVLAVFAVGLWHIARAHKQLAQEYDGQNDTDNTQRVCYCTA